MGLIYVHGLIGDVCFLMSILLRTRRTKYALFHTVSNKSVATSSLCSLLGTASLTVSVLFEW